MEILSTTELWFQGSLWCSSSGKQWPSSGEGDRWSGKWPGAGQGGRGSHWTFESELHSKGSLGLTVWIEAETLLIKAFFLMFLFGAWFALWWVRKMFCLLLMRIIIHSIAWEMFSFECRKSFALVLLINIKFNEDLFFFFFTKLNSF